jgi:anti-sigma B factor antagonist
METAIGVFSSRGNAENALQELLDRNVSPEEIVFLTRSGAHGEAMIRELGSSFMLFATGMTAGVGAAVLLFVPGIGQVAALGLGAAALLGLAGAGAESIVGKPTAEPNASSPKGEPKCSEDAAFFREVLAEGRSLVVVRTNSHEVAKVANDVLSRLGVGVHEQTPDRLQINIRQIGDVTAIDMAGRITLGEGSTALREMVRDLVEQGKNKILLNLHKVGYIDSSGLGELVKAYTTVRGNGGQLKLVEVSKQVQHLLELTKLHLVLEIEPDEASALKSFAASSAARTSN